MVGLTAHHNKLQLNPKGLGPYYLGVSVRSTPPNNKEVPNLVTVTIRGYVRSTAPNNSAAESSFLQF